MELLLKVLVILVLPLPLLLWPVLSIVGSLLVGFGYGFFAPLIATFEAVGEQVLDKLVHCFIVGFIVFKCLSFRSSFSVDEVTVLIP